MKKIISLFFASVLLTAVFSYSLKVFLKEDFAIIALKTMLIPCFTWTVLLATAYYTLPQEQKLKYFTLTGWVCMIGSAMLVPCGIYNFLQGNPVIEISVGSVIFCVVSMSVLFYILLPKYALNLKWWMAFNVLICLNMLLFYLSAKQ